MKKTSLMPRWWKKRFTAVITESDPSFKVVYLGNVLTGWAKGRDTHNPHTTSDYLLYCRNVLGFFFRAFLLGFVFVFLSLRCVLCPTTPLRESRVHVTVQSEREKKTPHKSSVVLDGFRENNVFLGASVWPA
jgi:hypothetical protein